MRTMNAWRLSATEFGSDPSSASGAVMRAVLRGATVIRELRRVRIAS